MADSIGNCEVLEEIGSGGMATVFRAIQQPLGRTVAIKALKPSIAVDSQFAKRFEREAHFLASLQHENILHVHDFVKQDGSMFIIMEHVMGIDVFDLLERVPQLPIEVAAIITLQVARALDYAHFRGIVHRDIKPANIMVSRQGEVKLMDFGIARDDTMRDLTETGTGLGTPSYMSPEQILGDKLDFRSDVFSLGIVLFQMITGRKPFIEDDSHTVMQKIRLDRYTPPRKLNPSVPRALERIMARCMEKMPANRYGSTQALIDDLMEFLAPRVTINHNARMVMFLREVSVITDAEADEILQAAGSRGGPRQLADRKQVKHVTWVMLMLAIAVGGSGAVIQVASGRFDQTAQLPSSKPGLVLSPESAGYIQVVADPWAEVYVDGQLLGVTPLARRMPLSPGRHYLKFVNPHCAIVNREVRVEQGKTERVEVALSPKVAGADVGQK